MIGMVALATLFFLGVISLEDQLMDTWVSTGPNITLDDWRQVFVHWAEIGLGVSLAAALFWFIFGQWFVGMNRWGNANKKRIWWLGLLVIAVLGVLRGFVFTPAVQEWGRLAWVCYVVNNLALYYLATVLFSPTSFKYVPWLAMRLRYW